MADQNNITAEADAGDQQEKRVQTDERLDMDASNMEDAIDAEHDQKVSPGDESRYEDDVDATPRDETR